MRRQGSPVFTGIRLLYRMLLVMLAAVLCLALSDPQPRRRLSDSNPPSPQRRALASTQPKRANGRQGGAAALTDRRISPAYSPPFNQLQCSSTFLLFWKRASDESSPRIHDFSRGAVLRYLLCDIFQLLFVLKTNKLENKQITIKSSFDKTMTNMHPL